MSVTALRAAIVTMLEEEIPGVTIRNRPISGPVELAPGVVIACVYTDRVEGRPDEQHLQDAYVYVRCLLPWVPIGSELDDRNPSELETFGELLQSKLAERQNLPDAGEGGDTWFLTVLELNFNHEQWYVDALVTGTGWNVFTSVT
jgi:hypothetical protein